MHFSFETLFFKSEKNVFYNFCFVSGEQGGFVQADRRLHRRAVRGVPPGGVEDQAKLKQVRTHNLLMI